jgi:hypothetical protein
MLLLATWEQLDNRVKTVLSETSETGKKNRIVTEQLQNNYRTITEDSVMLLQQFISIFIRSYYEALFIICKTCITYMLSLVRALLTHTIIRIIMYTLDSYTMQNR